DGRVWLSWVEPSDEGHGLRFTTFDGVGWQPVSTAAAGADWFVNWADFPSVVHLGDDRMAAHWLQKVDGGTYAYHVRMAVSTDGGERWSDAVAPHADASPTEHGFVSLFPLPDGVGAVWLDGRHTTGAHADDHDHGHGQGAMTLRAG